MRRYSTTVIALVLLWFLSTFAFRWNVPTLSENPPSGFRLLGRLAARVLWQQSEVFRDTGRWWMVVPLLRITTALDPTFAEAFDFVGWHIAYNLRAEEKDERQRFQWVKLGLGFYEQGLEHNPNDFHLLFGAGWTAYDKLGDTVLAAYYMGRSLNASGKFTKDVDWARHMLAHAYERMPNMRLALQYWEEAALSAPQNPVARGAMVTIEERGYVDSEAMSQNGYHAEAIQLMENVVQRPNMKFATIPRHILAQIYLDMGDIEAALAIIRQMRQWHASEMRAEFKARQWEELLKRRRLEVRE